MTLTKVARASALVLILVTLAWGTPARADYLEVRLGAIIRAEPSQRSTELDRPAIGARYALIGDGDETHGYLHIDLGDGRQGWIYRPRVTRHAGELAPSAPPTPIALTEAAPRIAVHYIDVGQGAAALIEFPCAAVMIDAGAENADAVPALTSYLDAFFARRADLNRRIETIFITHTHVDHNQGLRAIAQRFEIGGYVHNGIFRGSGRHNANWMRNHANASGAPLIKRAINDAEVVAAGRTGLTNGMIDSVDCGAIDPEIHILSARQDENPGWSQDDFVNGNNQSLVIRVDFGEASFLFTGDLEEPAIETMVAYYAGAPSLDVDVYHVGHHGSYNGTTHSLLAAMSPDIAVISAGDPEHEGRWTAWAYGHPRRVAIDMLDGAIDRRRANARSVVVADGARSFSTYEMRDAIYATPWDGTIIVRAGADGVFRVDTQR